MMIALCIGVSIFSMVWGRSILLAAEPESTIGGGQVLTVDPASYTLWPSGARTLTDVVWVQDGSSATFKLVNQGPEAAAPLTVMVLVDRHDPLTQTSTGSSSYSFSVPALSPQSSATVTVPLDYAQCDLFLTVDFGAATPVVFRTGNPAAC